MNSWDNNSKKNNKKIHFSVCEWKINKIYEKIFYSWEKVLKTFFDDWKQVGYVIHYVIIVFEFPPFNSHGFMAYQPGFLFNTISKSICHGKLCIFIYLFCSSNDLFKEKVIFYKTYIILHYNTLYWILIIWDDNYK